jgi:hypothetical protein
MNMAENDNLPSVAGSLALDVCSLAIAYIAVDKVKEKM